MWREGQDPEMRPIVEATFVEMRGTIAIHLLMCRSPE